MKVFPRFSRSLVVVTILLVSACQKEDRTLQNRPSTPQTSGKTNANEGMIYIMSNETGTNTIRCYKQQSNGILMYHSSTPSGGTGSGVSLQSQGSLIYSENLDLLVAVNAGSNTISSFLVANDGSLTLANTVSSNGNMPVSLTIYQNYLYVVNAGSDNISGYTITPSGTMTPITGSIRDLSSAGAGPAQIGFRPDGQHLYVTERLTNKISAYPVNAAGIAGLRVTTISSSPTPFGFDFFGTYYMIAAEGTTGTPNSATVTSYNALSSVSTATGPICNNQTSASCLKISKDGLYVFVTNTGSNSISTYATTSIGIIQLLDDNAANTGTAPADITLSANGTYLYTIDDGSHTISQFKRVNKAKLMKLGTITGLPASASGIAAY